MVVVVVASLLANATGFTVVDGLFMPGKKFTVVVCNGLVAVVVVVVGVLVGK